MINASGFSQVTTPGLPSWPRLMLNSKDKRAAVFVRTATWRSWELAIKTTTLMRWMINSFVAFQIWDWLVFLGNPIGRLFFMLLGLSIFAGVTKGWIHLAFDGFLARQLFAGRTRVWFTPQAIAFRSRLYPRGVVSWRSWKGQAVFTRFDVSPDPDAAEHQPQPGKDNRHCQYAQLLRLIIFKPDQKQALNMVSQPNLMRSIPVLEIDGRDAHRITMVLTAAVSLTQATEQHAERSKQGVDIDVS